MADDRPPPVPSGHHRVILTRRDICMGLPVAVAEATVTPSIDADRLMMKDTIATDVFRTPSPGGHSSASSTENGFNEASRMNSNESWNEELEKIFKLQQAVLQQMTESVEETVVSKELLQTVPPLRWTGDNGISVKAEQTLEAETPNWHGCQDSQESALASSLGACSLTSSDAALPCQHQDLEILPVEEMLSSLPSVPEDQDEDSETKFAEAPTMANAMPPDHDLHPSQVSETCAVASDRRWSEITVEELSSPATVGDIDALSRSNDIRCRCPSEEDPPMLPPATEATFESADSLCLQMARDSSPLPASVAAPRSCRASPAKCVVDIDEFAVAAAVDNEPLAKHGSLTLIDKAQTDLGDLLSMPRTTRVPRKSPPRHGLSEQKAPQRGRSKVVPGVPLTLALAKDPTRSRNAPANRLVVDCERTDSLPVWIEDVGANTGEECIIASYLTSTSI